MLVLNFLSEFLLILNKGREYWSEEELSLKCREIALGLVRYRWTLVCDLSFQQFFVNDQCQRNWKPRHTPVLGTPPFSIGDVRKDPEMMKRPDANSDRQILVMRNMRLEDALDKLKGKFEEKEKQLNQMKYVANRKKEIMQQMEKKIEILERHRDLNRVRMKELEAANKVVRKRHFDSRNALKRSAGKMLELESTIKNLKKKNRKLDKYLRDYEEEDEEEESETEEE